MQENFSAHGGSWTHQCKVTDKLLRSLKCSLQVGVVEMGTSEIMTFNTVLLTGIFCASNCSQARAAIDFYMRGCASSAGGECVFKYSAL